MVIFWNFDPNFWSVGIWEYRCISESTHEAPLAYVSLGTGLKGWAQKWLWIWLRKIQKLLFGRFFIGRCLKENYKKRLETPKSFLLGALKYSIFFAKVKVFAKNVDWISVSWLTSRGGDRAPRHRSAGKIFACGFHSRWPPFQKSCPSLGTLTEVFFVGIVCRLRNASLMKFIML